MGIEKVQWRGNEGLKNFSGGSEALRDYRVGALGIEELFDILSSSLVQGGDTRAN